jgi:hypothetical protein
MDKSITATWARKAAEEIYGKKVEAQINKCENSIKEAVSSNKFSCSVYLSLESATQKELRGRGFKVEAMSGRPMDDTFYEISW